jgi:RNA polymerase sigma-70 factor (ECF subfamily)
VRKQEPDRVAPVGAPGFEQLFRQAAPGLWRTIFAFAGGRVAIADDAVAEAFARALERFGQIRELVPWLYRTAFRIAVEELRRKEPEAGPEPRAAATAGLEALIPIRAGMPYGVLTP